MYGYDVFHEDIMKELINTVHDGTNKHAYLFTGPEGIGRGLAARLFAASLVCENGKNSPCGSCQACIGAKNDTNPDIIYIRPTEKKSISAEQAREIVSDAYIKPFESSKKVYIVEDASLLNEFAQNCLLKILEEPPEYIVFILIATSESVLLQTVLSRCTHIRFPAVSDEAMRVYIKKNYPEQEGRTELLTALSMGIPGLLDKILTDADYDRLRKESFDMLMPLLSSKRIHSYDICDYIEENKDKAEMIIDFWQSFLRDIMVIKNGASELITNIDMQEELKNLAFRIPDNFPIIALEQTIRAKSMLKRYVNLHSLSLNLSFSIKNKLYNQ